MRVIDLIIKLQQLDPNMVAVVDLTRDDIEGGSFRFKEVSTVEEIGTEITDKMVMISPHYWTDDETE